MTCQELPTALDADKNPVADPEQGTYLFGSALERGIAVAQQGGFDHEVITLVSEQRARAMKMPLWWRETYWKGPEDPMQFVYIHKDQAQKFKEAMR